jgi:hypothetical protein
MSSAAEYRENARSMMAKALASVDAEARQEYLRMAAAWNTLADGAEKFDRSNTVIPFEGKPPNPLADDSDLP